MTNRMIRVKGGERYVIESELGQGGMGTVYLVKDLYCGRPIALKVLSDETEKPEELSHFVKEARITAGLEHPNIVPIHELGQDSDESFYYTMKHVKGISLADILIGLRREDSHIIREFPLDKLLTTFVKVCDAIAFAHSEGILHQDLKPANIMIGMYGETTVLDWGLAQYIDERNHTALADIPGTLKQKIYEGWEEEDMLSDTVELKRKSIQGTPGYLAPEMINECFGSIDERSDIYALGGLLYSILTLKPSISTDNISEILKRICTGDIVPPQETTTGKRGKVYTLHHCRNGVIPEELSRIAMKALSLHKDDRYHTVREMQEDIERFQRGEIWHLIYEMPHDPLGATLHWDASGGEMNYVDGALNISGGTPQILLFKQELQGNLRMEFECCIKSDYLNDVGCFIAGERLDDLSRIPQSGYEFKYGAHGNKINVLTKTSGTIWMEEASPLTKGTTYHVVIERIDKVLRMVIDGNELFSVTDPDPLISPTRTAIGLLGWMSDIYYTNIKIYSLGTPWKSDIMDMAERHFSKRHYLTAMDLYQDVMESFPERERLQRAREGYKRARSCQYAIDNLEFWNAKLAASWPGKEIHLEVTRDGLSVSIPKQDISDLTPLAGMPIALLDCSDNKIEDISPLQGMPLMVLNCAHNRISDLSPLQGMMLYELYCEYCQITSLQPLHGMPLRNLNIENNPIHGDITPLQGVPLNWLSCVLCEVSDLSPLNGSPITALNCDANQISDLQPLQHSPLNTLTCSGNQISDLSPLKNMPLTTLHAASNQIRDLSPLQGMPLTMLSVQQNQIENLNPLTGLPLTVLTCGANRFSSLGQLVKNPPQAFIFDSDSLSTETLNWLLTTWNRDFRYQAYAEDVKRIIAARRKDIDQLRQWASLSQNGHRYLLIPQFMTWESARDYCEQLGGHLLVIRNARENSFVNSMFPAGSWFWMGLCCDGRQAKWVTDNPVTFTAYMDVSKAAMPGPKIFTCGRWTHDILPNAVNTFVIEWES